MASWHLPFKPSQDFLFPIKTYILINTTETTLFSHPLMMTFLACHKDQRFYYFQQSMGLSYKFWLASFSALIKGRAKVGSLPHLWITVIKLLLVRLSTNKPNRVFPKTQGERCCVWLNYRLTILYQKTADESLRFTDLPNNRNSFSSTKASDFGRWDKKGLRQEIDNFYFFFPPTDKQIQNFGAIHV